VQKNEYAENRISIFVARGFAGLFSPLYAAFPNWNLGKSFTAFASVPPFASTKGGRFSEDS